MIHIIDVLELSKDKHETRNNEMAQTYHHNFVVLLSQWVCGLKTPPDYICVHLYKQKMTRARNYNASLELRKT